MVGSASWLALSTFHSVKAIHRPAKIARTQITIEQTALALIVTDGVSRCRRTLARRNTKTFAKPIATRITLAKKDRVREVVFASNRKRHDVGGNGERQTGGNNGDTGFEPLAPEGAFPDTGGLHIGTDDRPDEQANPFP